jgi:hypothetical protein
LRSGVDAIETTDDTIFVLLIFTVDSKITEVKVKLTSELNWFWLVDIVSKETLGVNKMSDKFWVSTNSTISATQSITPDFSSLFISLNATPSIFSSFETQNLSDILLTPSVSFETISTNQNQFSSEVNCKLEIVNTWFVQ